MRLAVPLSVRPVALLVGLSMVGGAGCAGKAWRDARQANTSQAYAAFVANQPEHGKVALARRRAEDIDWGTAQSNDDADSYAMFVATHPSSGYVPEAQARGEIRAWDAAKEDGTVAGLEGYLARFGGGEHDGEAQTMIEAAWFRDAQELDSVESWSRYLVRYPVGAHVEEARGRRDALGWERATSKNAPDAYQAYLRQHPRGTHRSEAQAWLASLRVTVLQPVLVYRSTFRPERSRRWDRSRYQRDFERGLLYDLARDFEVRKLIVEDDPGRALGAVQERHGIEPGVGLLELVVDETEGRTFEPSGNATDIKATLSLYAPPTDVAVWSVVIEETTPTTLYGSTVESLYTEAVEAFGSSVRGAAFPIEKVGPERRD